MFSAPRICYLLQAQISWSYIEACCLQQKLLSIYVHIYMHASTVKLVIKLVDATVTHIFRMQFCCCCQFQLKKLQVNIYSMSMYYVYLFIDLLVPSSMNLTYMSSPNFYVFVWHFFIQYIYIYLYSAHFLFYNFSTFFCFCFLQSVDVYFISSLAASNLSSSLRCIRI